MTVSYAPIRTKSAARDYLEGLWSTGDLPIADELLHPSFVDNQPLHGQEPGIDGLKETVQRIRAAFPDLRFTVEDVIAEGDRVVSRWTARGTHRGSDYQGIAATGKSFTVSGIDIVRVDPAGRIIEIWHHWDSMGLMRQLGLPLSPTAE